MSRTERRAGIRYLKTEREIGSELGTQIPAPIRLFDLAGLGIDRARFLGDLAPSFGRLAWDDYDAKREQVAFLLRHFPDTATQQQLIDFRARYYAGETNLHELADLFRDLPHAALRKFEQIRSYRRRSIAQFIVTKQDTDIWYDKWRVLRAKCLGFRQQVAKDDPRAMERIFDPTADDVVRHQLFQDLIIAVAEMVEDAERAGERTVEEMTITFHQMGLITFAGEESTNAPEGIHRDGADYIVSALVVERDDVTGGESIVLAPDKERALLRVTLAPGQGLFQADTRLDLREDQQLWHNVTPVQLRDTDGDGKGTRNIFGFDIKVARPYLPDGL